MSNAGAGMAAAAGRGDMDSRFRGNDGWGRSWFGQGHDGRERCGAAGSGRALLARVYARVYGYTTPATLTPDSAALPVGVSAATSAAGAGACARRPHS